MKKALIAAMLSLLPLAGHAQGVTIMDATKAKLVWAWSQGTGGPVEKFTVRCGLQTGVYTASKDIVDPSARSTPLLPFVGAPGQYYCMVAAVNTGGAGNSSEISFTLIPMVIAPTAPTQVGVTP